MKVVSVEYPVPIERCNKKNDNIDTLKKERKKWTS